MGGLTFLPLKSSAAMRIWRNHLQNMQAFKESTFRVLAHPDATPEQLAITRENAINALKRHEEIRNLMRSKGYDV